MTYDNKFTGCGIKDEFVLDDEGIMKTGQEYINALQATADKGQGKKDIQGSFYDATNPMDLSGAFQSILQEITEQKTTFAAPIVPISHVSNAYTGDYVYISMFKPSLEDGRNQWIGNLKKYKLNDGNEFVSCDTDAPILDSDGHIVDTACS